MITITSLRTALNSPSAHFQQLKELKWADEDIIHSSYFAQTEIRIKGMRYILHMPLRNDSMRRAERFIPLHKHLRHKIIPRMELHRDEMSYSANLCQEKRCDILLELLPDALPLIDHIACISTNEEVTQLLNSFEQLKAEFHNANISHNNIRKENLLIDNVGRLYPIRWCYATEGAGGDDKALERLFSEIATLASAEYINRCPATTVIPDHILDKYLFVGNIHEGLIAIEDKEGWGYMDSNSQEVIKPQFLWANDFCEGRAEVETYKGMGLIDKQGNYIIEPIYDAVEFNAKTGWVRVCKNNEWALFDYSGEQLCDWSPNSMHDLTDNQLLEIR